MSRACVFCGRQGDLSKEHLWPDWLGKMYIRKGDEKHTFGSRTYLDRSLERDGVYERPGHLFTLKNRVVCRECNNGWMSEVENETKPILLKMIGGKKCKITEGEIKKISFWIALKIVTAEFAEKKERLDVTPYGERRAMMEERKIPSYFNIFVATHSTGHNSAWLRHSWTLAFSRNGPTPPLEDRQRNSQAISFIVGPIFFYVLHVRVLGFLPENHFNFGPMKKLWPSKMSFVRWPPKRPLRKIESDVIAFMAQDFTESDRVRFVPDIPNQS